MSVGPASFYIAFNAMDHWPAAESGFVGHGLGMEMSWAPKIKLGDVIWDTAGDLVEHNGCTFVKLS